MAVNFTATAASELLPVAGIRVGIAQAGIRKLGRDDLTVFLLDDGASVGAVFTQNRFCAAPVQVCREHLSQVEVDALSIRALVINTGNANAGTGQEGLARARRMSATLAHHLGVQSQQVLPFSTGVIMEQLPIERVEAGIPTALQDARVEHWGGAAQAIMTTDTVPKAFSRTALIAGVPVTVTGISKGAGMIRPNMATMLGFMATDACVQPHLMQSLARRLAEASFNRITVDGDTSTNDSFVVMASNQAVHAPITSLDSDDGRALFAVMLEVAQKLAQAIVRDGEGASKFMTITVEAGANAAECRQVAYAVAHSPLVKTAFFASDPNLGRILAAVGYAGIVDLDQTRVDLYLDDVLVVQNGGRSPDYVEQDGQRVMRQNEITVRVDLGRGQASDTVWTCDLSHDYVTINADYRS